MKIIVVFSCQRYIIFICPRGTRKEGNDQPHERDRNSKKIEETRQEGRLRQQFKTYTHNRKERPDL